MGDVLQDKAGGYTGSSGDQADLDFHKVGAIKQPASASMDDAMVLQLVMIQVKIRQWTALTSSSGICRRIPAGEVVHGHRLHPGRRAPWESRSINLH